MRTLTSSSTLLRCVGVALTSLLLHASAGAQVDPPDRVARLSYASGKLSFATTGSDDWTDASLNRPMSVGDSLWVPERGRAELHIGSSAFRLNEKSSLTFLTLSDDTVQLKLTRGSMVVRLRSLTSKEVVEINTPNLAFSLQEAGEYRITVNDDNTTNVMVRRGTAIAYGDRDSVSIREAEQVVFSGTNLSHTSIGRMPPYDTFDQWVNDRDRAEDTSVSARYVSREVIGYQQLDSYGSWETNAEYGAIWLPRTTEIGWAPYRNGNWLWVAPWGWTWVDRAPWGFAPYHYGRWAHIGARWAWVPGQYLHNERPVYAPALVAFIGGGNGFSASVSISSGRGDGPGVAWFPLAPGEAYRPSYAASSRYLNSVNRTVINNTTIVNNTVINNNNTVYINQRVTNAVTAVPTAVFVKGQFVGAAAKPLTPDQLTHAVIGAGAPAIAPSPESRIGATRRVPDPENGASDFRERRVVATFRPAQVPVVRSEVGVDRYTPGKELRNAVLGNQPDSRLRATVVPPMALIAPVNPAPNILLHSNERADNAERNGRFGGRDHSQDNLGNAARVSEPQSGADRRLNNETGPRYPRDNASNSSVIRTVPEPTTVTTPMEQMRRAPPVRVDERNAEPNNRQLNTARPTQNNVSEGRAEIRIDTRREAPQENAPSFNPRNNERVMAAPREINRPVNPAPAQPQFVQQPVIQQAPRLERQPVNEPRREAPMGVAKPEREKEQKEKSDSRNNLRERNEK